MRTALRVLPGWVEHPESSGVPTCVQCMVYTTVRLLLLQESSQHKNCTISLGWAVAIPTAPPVVRDETNCPKRVVAVSLVTVVGSHVQHIVLATEEITVTHVSHRPVKCQSRLWSPRGTKVNGSHHGDNPLLRLTGIQIATKSYATLQTMAPTNIKTVHQTSLLHIESNIDRLGLLSPTHNQRSQQQTGQVALQPVLINKSKFLKATHCTK